MAYAAWGPNANLNAASLNAWLGRIQTVAGMLEDFNDFNAGWLAANGAAVLEAAPFSYSVTDAGNLVSAVGDMAKLYAVANGAGSVATNGTVTLASATGYNFFTFGKLGLGFTPHG